MRLRKFAGFAFTATSLESCLHQILFLSVLLSGIEQAIQSFNYHVYHYNSNCCIAVDLCMGEGHSGTIFDKQGIVRGDLCWIKQGVVVK